jgi:hypothetical protein
LESFNNFAGFCKCFFSSWIFAAEVFSRLIEGRIEPLPHQCRPMGAHGKAMPSYSETTSQCHFAHQKSHLTLPGIVKVGNHLNITEQSTGIDNGFRSFEHAVD